MLGVSRADVWTMVVVGVAVGALAVTGVVAGVLRAVRREPLEVAVGSASGAPLGELGALVGDGALGGGVINGVTVLVDDAPGWVYAVEVALAVLVALIMLVIAACLVLLTRRLAQGQAFSRGNTWLLGSILIAVILWWGTSVAGATVRFVGTFESAAIGDWRAAGLSPVMDFPFASVLVAIGLLPLVAAFRLGERLQADSDGLV
ncbi:resistance to Congo red protein [Promicromonospora alba]|uniref:Resistance to Congo red protein n=1 Tax=Promicromonospora alba TaxID=1616110 RepID=A0ABV9HHP3_9MICO